MKFAITDLPEDIITKVIDILDDAGSFVCTCRQFYNIGKSYGYLKHLYFKSGDNLNRFKNKVHVHQRCIKSIVIDGLHDPQHWLPVYPKGIFLNIISVPFDIYLRPIYNFNPLEETRTEVLYIIASKFSPCRIKINWKMFKNLKRLCLSAHDIDLDGIEYLENVREVSVYIGNSNISCLSTENIKNIPKLQTINTNIKLHEKLYHYLIGNGVIVNHTPLYTNTNYTDLYMYLITGKFTLD